MLCLFVSALRAFMRHSPNLEPGNTALFEFRTPLVKHLSELMNQGSICTGYLPILAKNTNALL